MDLQNRQSVLTVDTSDEPYGLLTIAASSLMVTTEELDQTINIYVNREFGASGLCAEYEQKKRTNSEGYMCFFLSDCVQGR